MPKRHIRERELRPLEGKLPKIETAAKAGLRKEIDKALEAAWKEEKIAKMLGLPKDLPGLANLSSAEEKKVNETIGLISQSGGMLNMNNPALQSIGAIGLAYAVKPELVKGFLGSEVGSTIIGAASSYMLGSEVGERLGDSGVLSTGVGAGIGYALGVALGVPSIGLLFGGAGGLFGGRKKRRAKRAAREEIRGAIHELHASQEKAREGLVKLETARDIQRAAMEDFLEHVDLAQQSLLQGKQLIDAQRIRLKEQRDTNIGIVAKNKNEIRRVAGIQNESIRRETDRVLGRQKAQLAISGTSFAGSGWYITAETEAMGWRAEQEVNLRMKTELEAEAMKYRELMKNYKDLSVQLDYANNNIEKQFISLKSKAGMETRVFGSNLRVQDVQTKALSKKIEDMDRKISLLTGRYNKLGGDMGYRPFEKNFRWDITKDQKLLEAAERKAGALSMMSLGGAIRTTPGGEDPFDALINYGLFVK